MVEMGSVSFKHDTQCCQWVLGLMLIAVFILVNHITPWQIYKYTDTSSGKNRQGNLKREEHRVLQQQSRKSKLWCRTTRSSLNFTALKKKKRKGKKLLNQCRIFMSKIFSCFCWCQSALLIWKSSELYSCFCVIVKLYNNF